MAETDRQASTKIPQKCTFLCETSWQRQKGDIMVLDLAAIVGDDRTSPLTMTYVPTSAPEGREQAVALENGTLDNAIHAVVTDRR